jgi:1,4-dihydroxy-2-naphthoate octaprenyltransferase
MNNWRNYFLATRPAFLSISIVACLIGFSIASKGSQPNWGINFICLILVLLGHAAANVSNDYYDSINGCDGQNINRIYPFTGGSRFIQNKLFTEAQIKQLSLVIYLATILGGLVLCFVTTWHLVWIGILGLLLGWSYSAPPLKLMCRGVWGELAIIGAWALVVIGSAMLTEHDVTDNSVIIGLAYGLMVANILFVNQIPDIEADRNAEKLTLAVVSSKEHIWFWSIAFPSCAYSMLIAAIYLNLLTSSYALPLLTLPISLITARQLSSAIDDSKTLKKCIQKTIITTHLFGLLMLLSIWMS